MPTIEPLKQPGYEYPQSQTNILPTLPVRALVLSPGSGGKTTMITRLLVDKQFYGGKFSRIYWFSPSATVDDGLDPLREYVKKIQDQEEDPTFHDDFDPEFIRTKVTEQTKENYRAPQEARLQKEIQYRNSRGRSRRQSIGDASGRRNFRDTLRESETFWGVNSREQSEAEIDVPNCARQSRGLVHFPSEKSQ